MFEMLFIILFYMVLPIVVLILILISVTVLYQYIKYGNKIFNSFFPKDVTNARDQLLWLTLDKILWYKKILKPDYLKSNYILIDKNGISIFNLLAYTGTVVGKETDEHLYLNLSSSKRLQIENPFLELKKDEEIIKKLLPDVDVRCYLVILDNEFIEVDNNVNVIKYNQLLYNLKDGNKYTKEEVDQFLKVLLNK